MSGALWLHDKNTCFSDALVEVVHGTVSEGIVCMLIVREQGTIPALIV